MNTMPPASMKQFYTAMEHTRDIRRKLIPFVLGGEIDKIDSADIAALKAELRWLEDVPLSEKNDRLFDLGGGKILATELNYEIGELKKDLIFLESGEKALREHLASLSPAFDFEVEVKRIVDSIKLENNEKYQCFATDRDGTVTNYCGRYRSSIQSLYNAVFLTRFAQRCVVEGHSLITTSAPLRNPGLVDVNIMPEGAYIFAGSKGREYIHPVRGYDTSPVAEAQQIVLDKFNTALDVLVKQPANDKFTLIGSGVQYKFGQTTVARQDVGKSIPADESTAWLNTISSVVKECDPGAKFLRVEDTGLDVEVLLVVEGSERDYDKGDGLRFLNSSEAVGFGMEKEKGKGKVLIAGDTGSDVPLITAASSMIGSENTSAVFVSANDKLKSRIEGLKYEDGGVVRVTYSPTVDVFVTALNDLASGK